MVNGLYTASLGMTNIIKKQDVVANNLANANTTGFKTAMALSHAEVENARNDLRQLHHDEHQRMDEVATSFMQGPLVQTGNNMDLALSGNGFFTIETPAGERYTRNGGFALNTSDELVTLNGFRVLDDGGSPIQAAGKNIHFSEDGGVLVDGERVAKLGVVEFSNRASLQAQGDSLFANGDPAFNYPMPSAQAGLKQGFLEGSNVDVVSSMVQMIAYHRNYEADSKMVRAIDDTLAKAVNEVGKV